MMRGNKGITLIALIITIIVLLILAGVTIAMLMGPHGILTQADSSKVTTIEGTVDERVKLALQSARLGIANKAAVNNLYDATKNPDDPDITDCSDVIDWIDDDLNGTAWNVRLKEGSTDVIEIIYSGDDYVGATGVTGASITYTVKVSAQALDLSNTITYNPAHRS